MFKKPLQINSQSLLRNKERKKYRLEWLSEFSASTPEDVDQILSTEPIVRIKLQSPMKTEVFSIDEVPYFFTHDEKTYPTVYALWKSPKLVPCFVIHPPTSQRLLAGADLMLPGVIAPDEGLPRFKRGDIFSVRVKGNPFPFAVGYTDCCSLDIDHFGLHGKALVVLHLFKDSLWKHGDKSTPNYGFKADGVEAVSAEDENMYEDSSQVNLAHTEKWEVLADLAEKLTIDDAPADEDSLPSEGNSTKTAVDKHDRASTVDTQAALHAASFAIGDDRNVAANESGEKCGSTSPAAASTLITTTKTMDIILHYCLLHVLKKIVTDAQLPIDASAIFSKMVDCVTSIQGHKSMEKELTEAGVSIEDCCRLRLGQLRVMLDLKKSTYKKMPKMMKAYSKSGLLKFKEQRDLISIVSINRSHPQYISFQAESVPQTPVKSQTEESTAVTSCPGIKVEILYKPNAAVEALLAQLKRPQTKHTFYAESEYREILTAYIQKLDEERMDSTQACNTPSNEVLLDPYLATAVLTAAEKGNVQQLPKATLFKRFLATGLVHHRITKKKKVPTATLR